MTVAEVWGWVRFPSTGSIEELAYAKNRTGDAETQILVWVESPVQYPHMPTDPVRKRSGNDSLCGLKGTAL